MKSNNDFESHTALKSRKGLKFFSALSMALPIFMQSGQKIFADGHHYLEVNSIPVNVKILQNSFGERKGQMARVYSIAGGFWEDQHKGIHGKVGDRDMRFYCLEPNKVTPGPGTTSKYKGKQATKAVKRVLMVGFGANSAEEMGFPGKSSEAEYATQVAVWLACGAIRSDIKWLNPTAHKIFNYIQSEAKKIKDTGATKLKLTASNVNKKEGTATILPTLTENGEKKAGEGTLKLTGMTATQEGHAVTNKAKANYAIKVKLTDPAGGKGSLSMTVTGRSLKAPMYNADSGNSQDTVSFVAVPSDKITKTWSFAPEQKPDTPPATTSIKAMFDLKKNDDEGDQVDQAKFDVYESDSSWSQGKFIGTITTNKNGVARSGELDPGYYIAIERSTGKNLDVDKTPVHIDLTEANLKENAKVTHVKTPDGKPYDLYHLDVDGPINNHKKPKITSKLTNLEDNTQFAQPIHGPVALNEHLYFSHLVGTVTYNVRAWLMDKTTGQPVTINGQKIEASKTIGSRNNDTNDDGIEDQTDLQLKIPDASSLAGHDIVAYSEIARSDKPDHWTALHEDINDKQETVHFSKPSIHTNAVNAETNGKKLQPTDGETINDTVTYKELIPGKTYTLKGIVMDKETGKAVLNNGQKVEFTKTFTANDANGEVTASVKFDAHHYRNHRLVVFESLYYTDYLLTDHRDINDVNQSLDVTNPQLHTTLSDNTQKLVSPKALNTVEDVIRYTDLIPGQTYSVRGKLIDQVTGAPVMKRGVPVMATATFKPNMANGTVTLTFVFDGTQYTGHHLTAFESLYTNGRILVEHANLDDASQTISVDNKHDNVTPTPIPVPTPTPTPGGGGSTIINNNNNNNNNNSSNNGNNSSNNGNNSSNNGSNNSANNGSNNSGNNGANNGNNGSNNAGNNGNNGYTGSNNAGNNGNNGYTGSNNAGSNDANNSNNGANNQQAVANNGNSHANVVRHAVRTSKPCQNKRVARANNACQNKQVARPNTAVVKTPARQTAPASGSVLPTASMVAQPAEKTASANQILPAQSPASSGTLPQTGSGKDNMLQSLGAVTLATAIGTFVYFTRRKQTTGME